MIVGAVKEDTTLDKRITITPETAKNLNNLGLEVCLEKISLCSVQNTFFFLSGYVNFHL